MDGRVEARVMWFGPTLYQSTEPCRSFIGEARLDSRLAFTAPTDESI